MLRLYILFYMFLFHCIVMDLPNNSDFSMVKIHLLLLMSVIARHSEEGFRATIEAFDHYKVTCVYMRLGVISMEYICCMSCQIHANTDKLL